jgi:cell division transport system permease protein
MFSKFRYLLSESLRGFFYNKFMTFVVIANIAISLFFIGVFSIVFLNLNRLIGSAEDQINLEVFLEDSSPDIHILRNEIMNTEGVVETQYVSKDEAYNIFRREVGEEILAAVEGNPLPASFKVKIDKGYRTPEKLRDIRESLRRIPFVEEVTAIKDWVPKLERIRDVFISVSLAASLVFAFAIFFMVSSTIRVTFLARRDLIRILDLVGASELMIKVPFILEGLLKGFFGGLFSYGLLLAGLVFARRVFPEIQIYKEVLLVQIAVGIFLGIIASFKTVNISENA